MAVNLTYTSIQEFENAIPQKHQGALSNDTDGSYQPDSDVVNHALKWAEDMFESRVSVRHDYDLPVINDDDTVPEVVLDIIHDLAIFKLYRRRQSIPDDVREMFDVQMTYLDRIANRKANINVDYTGDDEPDDKTTEKPIINGDKTTEFDNFHMG